MFTRIPVRKVFPKINQIAKITTAQFSTRICKHVTPINVAPTKLFPNVVPRRLYAEQVPPEAMIVDYNAVNKATSDPNVLIVDVREPDEIKEHGKIPNSINIPLGSVTSALSKVPENEFQRTYQKPKPSEDTEIIFYCMIGKRSGMAQQNAMDLGFKNVKNYLGSWTDWATKVQTK